MEPSHHKFKLHSRPSTSDKKKKRWKTSLENHISQDNLNLTGIFVGTAYANCISVHINKGFGI